MEQNNNKLNLERENSPILFHSLDLLTTAKKVFYLQIIGTVIIILGVLGFLMFQNSIIENLQKRLEKRDVIILTNSGILEAKTITSVKEIVKQFSQLIFLTTLNYDNKNPEPQLDFMRIYSSPDIYRSFLDMITNDAKLQRKIYSTYLDTSKPIIVEELKKGKLFKITIYGVQYVYSNLSRKQYKVKLTLILEKTRNTMPGNFFNLIIRAFNLEKE